jgi:hypothetical protein
VRVRVQNQIVPIWVKFSKYISHINALVRGLPILFTQVPIQCQVMTKSCNKFSVVHRALLTNIPAIQTPPSTIVFSFLEFEMQMQTYPVGMFKQDFPLV